MAGIVRIAQINLHHSQSASALLNKELTENRIDIALVQEPWTNRGKILGLGNCGNLFFDRSSSRPRACIIVNKSIKALCMADFLDGDNVAIRLRSNEGDICMLSAYLPYEDEIPLTPLARNFVQKCTKNGLRFIVGCDANAHHVIWGSSDCNQRGPAITSMQETRNPRRTNWDSYREDLQLLLTALTIVMGITFMVYGSTRASALFHEKMLNSVLKSPMSFFDVTPMGRIINRFSTDMDTIDIHMIYDIDGWLGCVLSSVSTFIVIGMNTPIFLAALVPLVVVYYIFLKLHLNTSRQVIRLESTTRSPLYSSMLESIYGVVSIKAFKVEKEFTEKLEECVDNQMACSFSVCACNRWIQFWLDLIGSVIVLTASALALQNREDLGASFVGLVITYAFSVTDALMWLVRNNTDLETKTVAIERVDEYCQLQSEASWKNPDKDPAITWPENGEIVFDNYSTRYRENLDLVLKDINLNIHSNEKVGIVGRTGAGKSSVTIALFRIIEPAGGTILIDNIDVSKIGLHTLRSKLTIIPQDPVLFTGSLRFNLDPNNEYEDSDIWQSLENSHLKEFVSSLADGLQHSIEEGGGNLSAGQKQLLCLSRALLKKSKILILDEATAAVDMDTDSLVQDTIKTAFAKHTVITIAHRLNTIMDYDKIVVMDAGSVVEVGSPADLLKNKNSHFYEMSKTAGLI